MLAMRLVRLVFARMENELFPGVRYRFSIKPVAMVRLPLRISTVVFPYCALLVTIRSHVDILKRTISSVRTDWLGKVALARRLVPSLSAGSNRRAESMLNPLNWFNAVVMY